MHFKRPLLFLLCTAFLVGAVHAQGTKVTLQNGLDGYEGCSDTYLDDASVNANKSTEDKLKTSL